MLVMLFSLLLIGFGLYALVKGELPLVAKYRLRGASARLVGIVLLLVGLILPSLFR